MLLFNEADQLVSKRMNAHNGVDQMHNGIQNLLLEEMENFDGILIGTTNLETQMDPAFERRWIVKINFGKPNELAQHAIWKSLMPELDENAIKRFVNAFTFSPGEILNITKRLDIDIMLGLNTFEYENRIFELCKTEKFLKQNHQVMGFNPISQHKTAS
jgi:SpoVK/Ycf46/Vps4 family AAA+-type ATPase